MDLRAMQINGGGGRPFVQSNKHVHAHKHARALEQHGHAHLGDVDELLAHGADGEGVSRAERQSYTVV